MKEWKTHYVGVTESGDNWQPQAEKLAIFYDGEAKTFRMLSEAASSTYVLDGLPISMEIQFSCGGRFPEMSELPLNQFIPVVLYSVGNEPATTLPVAANYEEWQTSGKSYDYVIGIEVRQDTTQW